MGKHGRRWRKKHSLCSRKNCEMVRSNAIDSSIIALRKWMKTSAGFAHCNLQPANFNDTGRGIQATRSIRKDGLIIAIPKALLITTETVLQSPVGKIIKENSCPAPLTATQILSIFLIYERHKGNASFWHPYINVLPGNYTNAAYWNETEQSLLLTDVRESAEDHIRKWRRSYDDLASFIECVESKFPHTRNIFTPEAYRWAWSTVNTRAVYMKQAKCPLVSSSEDNVFALAPLLDLLNHSATAEVTAGFNPTTQCYEIRTLIPYKKHRQVFISYGPHDNAKLLVEYGFLLPVNTHNVVVFHLDDLQDISDRLSVQEKEKRFQIITENEMHRSLTCNNEGFSWSLQTALKILGLRAVNLAKWKNIVNNDKMSDAEEDFVKRMSCELLDKAKEKLQKELPLRPYEASDIAVMASELRRQLINIIEVNEMLL